METVVEHLTNMISASEHAVSCFRSLHSALEDYGGTMQPIRTEFQAIITDAAAAGLTVSQAGTQVTISHPADVPGGIGAFFASLRERCETNQRKFAYAETLLGDDLASICLLYTSSHAWWFATSFIGEASCTPPLLLPLLMLSLIHI